MKILVFDAGKTTGCLCAEVNLKTKRFTLKVVKEYKYNERFSIYNYIDTVKPDLVILEDFKLYAHKASDQINSRFPSVLVNGIIELSCYLLNIDCVYQQPNVKKRIVLTPEQKKLALGSEHMKDVIQHLIYYIETA